MTTFNEADKMTEKLKALGVDVRIAHYTGDSSYPTEYTIAYQGISAVGPTFDLALMEWIEKLVAKAAVVKDSEEK
jgi:hypothetical protein